MSLPLVQEEADAAEAGVGAEGTVELPQPGVSAVLVVLQSLSVAAGVGAVLALMNRWLLVLSGVFGQHVIAEFVLTLAGICADLTHERLGLVPQLVAAELVHAVTTVRTLVTLVPGRGDVQSSLWYSPLERIITK